MPTTRNGFTLRLSHVAEREAWLEAGCAAAELARTIDSVTIDDSFVEDVRGNLLAASSPSSGHSLRVQIGADCLVGQIDSYYS